MATAAVQQIQYKDKWLMYFVYPAMALAVVHIANDNSLAWLLQTPSYYTDILFALGVTYCCGFYVKSTAKKLDVKFSWQEKFRERLLLQSGFMALAVLGIGLLEMLYLYIIDIPLAQSAMFYYELPLAAIFLLILNLLYYIMHLQNNKLAALGFANVEAEISRQNLEKQPPKLNYYVVQAGQKDIALAFETIAYFFIDGKAIFVKSIYGETYLINEPLEKVFEKLDENDFYRANRQIIIHRNAIETVSRTLSRKLIIAAKPDFGKEISVSKVNASAFTGWWNGKVSPLQT